MQIEMQFSLCSKKSKYSKIKEKLSVKDFYHNIYSKSTNIKEA